MVKLEVIGTKRGATNGHSGSGKTPIHRAAPTEGEAVRRLLEANGYPVKKTSGTQWELACPFHEDPGPVPRNKSANFYVNRQSGLYFCHSASCGEKGNLQTLERCFGIEGSDPSGAFQGREHQLRRFEELLTAERKQVFYNEGISDETLRRFRIGWVDKFEAEGDDGRLKTVAANCYVIPYLEGRRPVAFRFYDPKCGGPKGSKYWWEPHATARLYNPSDGMGDKEGRVFICEGEKKAMLLTQIGYAAVSVPGAANFKPEWHSHFSNAKKVYICFDSDNPNYHVYPKCNKCGEGRCAGHNPGQEAALRLLDSFGWRATNVVLPLPSGERKVDVNEYFMRDGHSSLDFAQLALGISKTPYLLKSFAEIEEDPPDEMDFVIEHGILPQGGRLLISGQPKTGKSILVEHLALSVASGIPFLGRYGVDKPRRVMLLDRELGERALFDRLSAFVQGRAGYRAGKQNLLIDHDHMVMLDAKDSADELVKLITENGAEVVIFDTAYKFFEGDVDKGSGVRKAFLTLDQVIQETGVSVVLTHHQRKRVSGQRRRDTDLGDQDNVAGHYLWTGWPNGTILLDFLDRRLSSPFNVVATFAAFRNGAPPDPLALYRDHTSINYTAIDDYRPVDHDAGPELRGAKISLESVGDLLIDVVPIAEEDFLHLAATKFACRVDTVRPYVIDLIDQGYFLRTDGRPPVLKYAGDRQEQTYEEELGLPLNEAPQLTLVADDAS